MNTMEIAKRMTGDNPPSLAEVKEWYIRLVVQKVGGSRTKAARILGVSEKSVYNWCAQWNIPNSGESSGPFRPAPTDSAEPVAGGSTPTPTTPHGSTTAA